MRVPPCPTPTMAMVIELEEGRIPENTETFLAELERYCSAIDALRN